MRNVISRVRLFAWGSMVKFESYQTDGIDSVFADLVAVTNPHGTLPA
jgi:hypothetical protein